MAVTGANLPSGGGSGNGHHDYVVKVSTATTICGGRLVSGLSIADRTGTVQTPPRRTDTDALMPMSPHRPALAAILLAAICLGVASFGGPRGSHATPSYGAIATTALAYEGAYEGQCWPWVRKVVFEATGREMGFDYREGFFEAGAIEITDLADVRDGDVIQVADDADTAPDADYPGLHTSIVLDNLGGGAFTVIDSNSQWDGIVRVRANYDPFAGAASNGLEVHIYRFGAGGSAPAAPLPGPLRVGEKALVNTPGDCLNLRSGASREYEALACLGHRSEVTVVGGPVTTDGITWWKVRTGAGEGWMSGTYLVRAASAPGASGAPDLPQRPYRAYLPALSN